MFALRIAHIALVLAVSQVAAEKPPVHPGLAEVKTIYLMSMSAGLDQYLAHRLTKAGRFEVVTDPAKADAVFTDRLGLAFEQKWAEMYPPPPSEEEAEQERPASGNPMDAVGPGVARISSFSRGRGNTFLVSRKTGAVVWSNYQLPSSSRPDSMDKLADKIVDRLEQDLEVKQ